MVIDGLNLISYNEIGVFSYVVVRNPRAEEWRVSDFTMQVVGM